MTAEAGNFRLGPIGFFLPAGERLFLTGPTGSGKSLLLRIIAGVAAPRAGRITLNGADLGAMAPEGRQTGWLPQETMLFPHLDGRQNIEFGARGAPPPAGPSLWPALITELEIEPLLARRPEGLSGGEQQRLALARALWRQPRILLLDEPLSALGPEWRPRLETLLAMVRRGDEVVIEAAHQAPADACGSRIQLQAGKLL